MHIATHMHALTCMYTHKHILAHAHTYSNTCTHLHMHIHVSTCTHLHTHTHLHMHTHIHTHITSYCLLLYPSHFPPTVFSKKFPLKPLSLLACFCQRCSVRSFPEATLLKNVTFLLSSTFNCL